MNLSCEPHYAADNTFFYQDGKDCSRRDTTYLGIFIFESLSISVVTYILSKRLNVAKGQMRVLVIDLIMCLLAIWVYWLGFYLQEGMFEISMISLGIFQYTLCFSGIRFMILFLDPLYAIVQAKTPKKSLFRLGFILSLTFLGSTIGFACVIRDPVLHNIVLNAWCGYAMLGSILVLSLMFRNMYLLENKIMEIQHSNQVNNNQNRYDTVLAKVRILRISLIAFTLCVEPPLTLLLVIFNYFSFVPYQFIFALLLSQCILCYAIGLEIILREKKSNTLSSSISGGDGDATTSSSTGNKIVTFTDIKYYHLFHLKSEAIEIQSNTFLFYLFGKAFSKTILKLLTSSFLIKSIYFLLLTGIYIVASLTITTNVFSNNNNNTAVFVCLGFWIFITIFGFISSISIPDYFKQLIYSSKFQLRNMIVLVSILTGFDIVEYDHRCGIIVILFSTPSLFYNLDCYVTLIKNGFIVHIFTFSAISIPIFNLFLIYFDLIFTNRQQTILLSTNKFPFSVYQLCGDMLLCVVLLNYMDVISYFKFGGRKCFLYSVTKPKVKLVPSNILLIEEEDKTSDSMFNFHFSLNTCTSKLEGENQYLSYLLIKESDTLFDFILKQKNWFLLTKNRFFWFGFSVISLSSSIIVESLVLTGIIRQELSLLSMGIMFIVFIQQISLKSYRVLLFLLNRIEFQIDLFLSILFFLGWGFSLNWTLRTIPILISSMFLLFDLRISDSNAYSNYNPYSSVFYILAIISLILIPSCLMLSGQIIDGNSNISLQFLKNEDGNISNEDLFSEFPPANVLARMRLAQTMSTISIVYVVKILLRFLEIRRNKRTSPDEEGIYLEYLIVPNSSMMNLKPSSSFTAVANNVIDDGQQKNSSNKQNGSNKVVDDNIVSAEL